jgi:hypothetical protein
VVARRFREAVSVVLVDRGHDRFGVPHATIMADLDGVGARC